MNKKYIVSGLLVAIIVAGGLYIHSVNGNNTVQNGNLEAAATVATTTPTTPAKTTTPTATVGTVTVTSPAASQVYKAGQTITVKWNTAGIATGNTINILLSSSNNLSGPSLVVLAQNIANSGQATVKLPTGLSITSGASSGNTFSIIVTTGTKTAVSGVSGSFTITGLTASSGSSKFTSSPVAEGPVLPTKFSGSNGTTIVSGGAPYSCGAGLLCYDVAVVTSSNGVASYTLGTIMLRSN